MQGILANKHIVVTGANRGIGKAITERCAENGADVWAAVRTMSDDIQEWAKGLSDKNSVNVKLVEMDLSLEESIRNAASGILKERIRIDGIVNNAGIAGEKTVFSMTSFSDVKNAFEINFFGPMFFTQRLLKNMIRNTGGSIVNISSVAVFDGKPSSFSYISSKAAVIGATRKLSDELGSFGIRVNAIAPGVTDTDMLKEMSEDALNQAISKSSLKRKAVPKDIADGVVYLLSDMSSYVTGQVIRIDGGGN